MTDNSLDDIFGSSPPHPTIPSRTEPSELPSLRRQHVTSGYREGISASKGEHVQRGFDAGFPVGAQLGMRAGTILGILEGVVRGYESRASSAVVRKQPGSSARAETETEEEVALRREKRERVLKMFNDAVGDLDVRGVFAGLEATEKDGEKPETRLRELGDKVVSPWEGKVNVARWEEVMGALEMKEHQRETQQS
ncbi:hypothetical protein BDV25DRAFT_22739 [Aspergillus avenaceus]|uniref:Protein YAE1 n=1 Tax=Aspergillus avenaceus TaxID=36643 RepID=A0A5N6TP17_ASPAV|nr:hypothetical protein BDV25DRAFT_22739 [Aspergillus avenaceus]